MALAGMFLLSWIGAAQASAAVAKIAAGGYSTFFIKTDGSLWALGDNTDGQLGDSTYTRRSTPVQAIGGTNVTTVATGSTGNTFFLKTDGTVWAMGYNLWGAYGDPSVVGSRNNVPIQVSGIANVTGMTGFASASVFLKIDGTLWMMGGPRAPSTPVQVNGGTNVTAIAASYGHILFIKTDDSLWAMGNNSDGQLGTGTEIGYPEPVPVSGGTNVAASVVSH
jgi:alpha-tubulin suppressor-like RCC1 family protein